MKETVYKDVLKNYFFSPDKSIFFPSMKKYSLYLKETYFLFWVAFVLLWRDIQISVLFKWREENRTVDPPLVIPCACTFHLLVSHCASVSGLLQFHTWMETCKTCFTCGNSIFFNLVVPDSVLLLKIIS